MVKTGQLTELNGRQTLLLDPELRRREEENRSYMMHLENRFLLLNFNLESGRDTSAEASKACMEAGSFPPVS